MYSFAGPRVGSPEFASAFDSVVPDAWRMVNPEDLVTVLPFPTPLLLPLPPFAAIIISVLVRFGMLSSVALFVTLVVLAQAPLTLDWSTWYAGRSFALLAFFVALLLFAFHTSLGGKPLFGKALLED